MTDDEQKKNGQLRRYLPVIATVSLHTVFSIISLT